MARSKYATVTLKLSLNLNVCNIFFPLEEIEHIVLSVIKPSVIGENAGPKNQVG